MSHFRVLKQSQRILAMEVRLSSERKSRET